MGPRIVAVIAGVAVLTAAGVANASVVEVTSSSALGANDSIDWGQLPLATILGSPQSVNSAGGLNAIVSSAGGQFERLDEGGDWTGNFAPGEHVLWDVDAGPDITIDFAAPIRGAGAQIQTDAIGPFIAEIVGSDGMILSSFFEAGNSDSYNDNSAIFIGLLSTSADIGEIRFYISDAAYQTNDFAIGTLELNTTSAVPEPDTWAMILLGFFGLGAMLRYRQKARPITAA